MIKDIKVFEDTIFKDNRGLLWTSWEIELSKINFKHDKFSVSKKMFCGVCTMITKLGN